MLDPDVFALLAAGSGLIVGTVSPDGEPRATRAWHAIPIDPDAGRLRVLVTADDPVAVANLAVGAAISVTAADVVTLRSAQVKGEIAGVGAPTDEDREGVETSSAHFFQQILETDGTPLELTRRILPLELLAVDVVVAERFDQSPGPQAGSAVEAPA